ncbi:hypothetical protein C8J57DRAFT_757226 [Mycena rebaudengoi]|nr:hypothetical protein C8J57DRAFT_757226 [Mycena rebaudengoi]
MLEDAQWVTTHRPLPPRRRNSLPLKSDTRPSNGPEHAAHRGRRRAHAAAGRQVRAFDGQDGVIRARRAEREARELKGDLEAALPYNARSQGELSPTTTLAEMIEYKRRQNTIAARKSLEHPRALEGEVHTLRRQVEVWRGRPGRDATRAALRSGNGWKLGG